MSVLFTLLSHEFAKHSCLDIEPGTFEALFTLRYPLLVREDGPLGEIHLLLDLESVLTR